MRLLVLNWRDPRNPEAGGAEVHLHEILRRTAAAGHEVTQVSCRVRGLPSVETIDGVRVLRRGGRYTFNLGLRRFCERLGMERFDLVVEDLCKVPFYSPRWSPVPVLTVVPHLFGTTAYREVGLPLALYVDLMERPVPRVYGDTPLVAISESTRADLVGRGLPAENISVIPCGIDTDTYSPGPPDAEPGLFLYVGRIKRYKGIHLILDALARLRSGGRDHRLVVLGSGDYLGALTRRAERLGLEGAVDFRGFVPEEEKVSWLRRAWCAVLPSEKEGWGLTVIEANACGTPVVASDSDGLRDSVRHGETGLLVPHGDVDELAASMEEVASDRLLRESMGAEGIRWAERFDWDDTADRMMELMERVASGGSAPHE